MLWIAQLAGFESFGKNRQLFVLNCFMDNVVSLFVWNPAGIYPMGFFSKSFF